MKRLRNLAARVWYHRPVFMTLARLDELEMDAWRQGADFAEANPKGTVITERRLTLVVSR